MRGWRNVTSRRGIARFGAATGAAGIIGASARSHFKRALRCSKRTEPRLVVVAVQGRRVAAFGVVCFTTVRAVGASRGQINCEAVTAPVQGRVPQQNASKQGVEPSQASQGPVGGTADAGGDNKFGSGFDLANARDAGAGPCAGYRASTRSLLIRASSQTRENQTPNRVKRPLFSSPHWREDDFGL